MRPFVVLRYQAGNVWTRPAEAGADEPPHLQNASDAAAYDIRVSALVVDDAARYHFCSVASLYEREQLPLDACIRPRQPSLTAAISRSLVADVLAGRRPVTHWLVKISYRDEEGRPYSTCCEIRIVRLPLEIEAAAIPCRDAEALTADDSPAPLPEELAGARC